MSPSLQLCRCLLERRCALTPVNTERPQSQWSELSNSVGTARLGSGKPGWWHPRASGPTFAWRQPFPSMTSKTKSWSERLKLWVTSTAPHGLDLLTPWAALASSPPDPGRERDPNSRHDSSTENACCNNMPRHLLQGQPYPKKS